jgi:phosphonoacetaldehyde dehydrogenase
MNAPLPAGHRHETLRIAGEKVAARRSFEVRYPYTGEVIGTVPKATVDDVRRAFDIGARLQGSRLTRYDRYRILMQAAEISPPHGARSPRLITARVGLCLKDTTYEVGRASDVLLFAANQALKDDGQIFSCDLTPTARAARSTRCASRCWA